MAVHINFTGETLQSVLADMRMLLVGDPTVLGAAPGLAAPYGSGPQLAAEDAYAKVAESIRGETAQPAAEAAKRTRRTKEQIAADNAAAEAAEAAGAAPAQTAEDPAAAAQDEADERAETEAARAERPEDKKLTHDDCRSIMGAYAKKFGMAAAQEDLNKVWQAAGVQAQKVSEIAEADIGKAHAALFAAVENNPFDRKAV